MDRDTIIAGVTALAGAHGIHDLTIDGVRQLQGGNSSEIWAFDGRWTEAGVPVNRPLVLRSGMGNEFALSGRGAEFALLHALHDTGLPAPRVWWFDPDGAYLGRASMVMDRCAGRSDRNIMTDRNTLALSVDQRAGLGRQMMDLLARLHSVDASPFVDREGVGGVSTAAAQLADLDAAIVRLEAEPMVELRAASWWLRRNLPPAPATPVVVHGDYRPANLLVEGDGISAILDWEFTHIGDPMEDLGWFLTPYYAHEHLIPGAFSAEDAIRHYEVARGVRVDRAAVRFWATFAMFNLAYMTVAALRWTVDGDARRMAASGDFIIQPLLAAITAPDGREGLA